jgi:hypothetical protein
VNGPGPGGSPTFSVRIQFNGYDPSAKPSRPDAIVVHPEIQEAGGIMFFCGFFFVVYVLAEARIHF